MILVDTNVISEPLHTAPNTRVIEWIDSSTAITGDVYGHTSDDTARSAIDGLAERRGP
jgi:hypothetical protein